MAGNPKSSAQQVKTRPEIVESINKLLDDHIHSEIADILNRERLLPGGSARPGQAQARFDASRVAYLVHQYALPSCYQRPRDRGMLTTVELAAHLGIHQTTLIRWVEHGLVTRHADNAYAFLYENPGPNPPAKHSSRWDTLADRAVTLRPTNDPKSTDQTERGAV